MDRIKELVNEIVSDIQQNQKEIIKKYDLIEKRLEKLENDIAQIKKAVVG